MLIGTNFDFDQNQLLRPVLHNLTSDPGSGVEGQLYVNTASHLIRAYLNGAWTTLSTAGGTLTGSATAGQIAVWSGTNSVGGITAVNSAVLVTNGSGVASLSTDLPTAETIGGAYIYRAGGTDIPVSDGGTGQTAFTQYALIYAPTTGSLGNIVDVSATGKALVSTSAGAPVFGKVTLTQPASQATLTLASGTTLQTANNVTFGGSYAITINSAGSSTNVTLPASGTLVGSADSGTVTNAMLANTTIKIGSSTYTLGAAFVTTLGGMSNIGIIAGTTTVAPFNFSTSGSVLLTTAVIGALEWDQTSLYITNAGPTRRTLLYADFSNIGSSILSGTNGGTGVNNGSKTITLGGNLTTTGAYNTSFTQQGSFTFILPPQAGTLISTGDTGTVTNTMLAGSIANNKLANSTILLGGQTLTLGAAATTALTGMTNITFAAGTATVAPINLTSGVVLTTPVVGAFEFVTDTLSFTITTGATRKTIAFTDSAMTNLVGAAWATPYQTGLNTTGMLANPAAANRVMLSGNSAAPSWSGGTLTIAASGSLAIPAFAVSFANAFSTLGAYSIALTATNVTAITIFFMFLEGPINH